MFPTEMLINLAKAHGTPLFVVDHDILRENYQKFSRLFPRVQIYYAVKANPDPAIIKTFYDTGGSFDVASIQEFSLIQDLVKNLPAKERQDFIWNRIIYANPIKRIESLIELDQYKPLVTFDNEEEIKKIKMYAPRAGLVLRLQVPSTGAQVELSSKFGADPGNAVHLMRQAAEQGLVVEGLSFHVGSQNTNFDNFIQALSVTHMVYEEAILEGITSLKVIDIGGGFPAPYSQEAEAFEEFAPTMSGEIDRLFPPELDIAAEPGRYLVATSAVVIASVLGKAVRNGKQCYYINDGVYHTYSGVIFDHNKYKIKAFKPGETQICSVFGPTCDSLDTISMTEELPDLEIGDLVYSENIGAYSHASSTWFNGFPPAKVVHIHS